MPFKANQDRRHHIPKQRHRVTNWAAYDIALRQRGSLTVWFTEAAIASWKAEPRCTRGGQPRYSALAITTALTLRAVFRLALRQTEGLIASLLRLLGLDLAAPDHSTISRRGETLPVSRPRPGSEPVHLRAARVAVLWIARTSARTREIFCSSRVRIPRNPRSEHASLSGVPSNPQPWRPVVSSR